MDSRYPSWADGVARHEHLHDHGPTPMAFNFKRPFDEKGHPVRLDKARIRRPDASAVAT